MGGLAGRSCRSRPLQVLNQRDALGLVRPQYVIAQRRRHPNKLPAHNYVTFNKGKGSPYSITERRVAVLGSQPASDVSHKPGGRLPLLSARPAVTLATLKRAATFGLV